SDIGNVAVPGSASYSNGTFSVSGDGVDIWGKSDTFRFVYQQLVGDGEIIARTASLQNTNPFAKGGVMFRESLAADAKEVNVVVTPVNGVRFIRRNLTGGA